MGQMIKFTCEAVLLRAIRGSLQTAVLRQLALLPDVMNRVPTSLLILLIRPEPLNCDDVAGEMCS